MSGNTKMNVLNTALVLIALTIFLAYGTACHDAAALVAAQRQSMSPAIQQPSSVQQQKEKWHVYVPPDKSFSVELPCEPKQRNVSEPSTPVYAYSCGEEDASSLKFFEITVANLRNTELAKMQDEAVFERTIMGWFTPNHRIVKLSPIKVDGGIGRELILQNKNDDMDNSRARVILSLGRHYDVAFGSTDVKELESQIAERFFATFKPK